MTETIKTLLAECATRIDVMDARYALATLMNQPRSYVIAHSETAVTPVVAQQFKTWVTKRESGYPMAYLTRQKDFYDVTLEVNESVLIPRPETEMLVEHAIIHAPEHGRVLELGTGSGAIAIAIARARADISVTAVDISPDALETAKRNAARNGVDSITWIKSDWFAAIAPQSFDMIISNPPYLRADDPHLQTDIAYEPRGALVAGETGLECLEAIIEGAIPYLAEGGQLCVEHGYDQGPSVLALMQKHGYTDGVVYQDFAQQDRMTVGCYLRN